MRILPILEQLAVELPHTHLVWIKKLGWSVPLSGCATRSAELLLHLQ